MGTLSSYFLITYIQQLLKNHKGAVETYFNDDLKKKLLDMLQHLKSYQMNYPLTDTEASPRAIQPCTHWWLAPEVLPVLQELDILRKKAKSQRLVR